MASCTVDVLLGDIHFWYDPHDILLPSRWLDGAFLDLEAPVIEGEVDDYYRELYKIQKIFNLKMKKLVAEREERERDRKKRRKHHAPEDAPPEEPEPEVIAPSALTVCNSIHEHMREFKVGVVCSSHCYK